MSIKYQGLKGQVYLTGEKLASGGEGVIFEVEDDRSRVIKIFKPEKRSAEREEKIKEMVQANLTGNIREEITWPQDVVYNSQGFAGYVMQRVEQCEPLTSVYSSGVSQFDLRYRLLVAVNLCYAIQTVHEMGQVCGDLNPQNISVNLNMNDENAFHVTLVDADSYHFTARDKTYRCEVGLADYIAPELQNRMSGGMTLKSMPLPTYTKETDLFALAVHIFSLLMNGCHPFACAKTLGNGQDEELRQMSSNYVRDSVVAPQPIENIRDGFFPFYEKRDGISVPVYAPEIDALPKNLRALFVRTFVDGYSDPSMRVKAEEWIDALFDVKNNISSCESKGHYYFDHAAQCPICGIEEKIAILMSGGRESSDSGEKNRSESDHYSEQELSSGITNTPKGHNNPHPMKYYKYLINFALFVSAGYNFENAFMLIISPSRGASVFYGIYLVFLACFQVYTRFQLARYKANGPRCFYISESICAIMPLFYLIMIYADVQPSISEIIEDIKGRISWIGVEIGIYIAEIALSYVYFTKRKELFTNGDGTKKNWNPMRIASIIILILVLMLPLICFLSWI